MEVLSWTCAVEYIYGSVIMLQVSLNVCDGDKKIIDPIDEFIRDGRLGGKRARCFWHEVTQPYQKLLARRVRCANNKYLTVTESKMLAGWCKAQLQLSKTKVLPNGTISFKG